MPANFAGRMYFFLETQNNPCADFIEFTIGPDVFNGNTTRVDGFGLKLAMRSHARDGYDVTVGEDLATFPGGPRGYLPDVHRRGAGRVRRVGTGRGAVPDPRTGKTPQLPTGRRERHVLRRPGRDRHLRLRGVRWPTTRARAPPSTGIRQGQIPASTTRVPRPTTTRSSGTTTPSTAWPMASPTTITRSGHRMSPTAIPSTCWWPSAGERPGAPMGRAPPRRRCGGRAGAPGSAHAVARTRARRRPGR